MKLGVMYPGDEFPMDEDALDLWIDTVVSSGFDHVIFGDHVLGVDASLMPEGWDSRWPGKAAGAEAYTYRTVFREPMVLFGYLAARTELELVTGVLVSPQRQTALLAKQAAEVDLLSRGRLRLAIGLGWNPIEYQGLGASFEGRGRMLDEQLVLLRQFWNQDVVTFDGEFHDVLGSGIMSLPVQRPIPLWTGAHSRIGFKRVGRLADGCLLPAAVKPDDGTLEAARRTIGDAAKEAGRDPEDILLEGRVWLERDLTTDELEGRVEAWRRKGLDYLYVDTRYCGRESLDEHLDALARAGRTLTTG